MAYAEADIPYLCRRISCFTGILICILGFCRFVCVSICHISFPLYILLFRLHSIIIRYCLNFQYWYLEIARFNTKATITCMPTITHTLTLMTVDRYYPAYTHLSLCQKVMPLIPQHCVKIKLISLTKNYHDKMVYWHCHFLFFQFTICSPLKKVCLFWARQPWHNLLTMGMINRNKVDCYTSCLMWNFVFYCNNWLLILTRMSIFLLT